MIVLLIGFLLMRTYLGSSTPGSKQAAGQRAAIDAAKERAAQVEDLQRKRLEQAEQIAE
ncbi:MAG: hypothetical protein ACREQJ_06295 [Candidatus Binatia bacterium]